MVKNMTTQINVEKNTGNDREAIQKAIDLARSEKVGTVVIGGGEWFVDDTCFLYDAIRVIIDGAVIHYTGENNIIFRNSNAVKSYANMIEFTQKNIVITGINDAKIIGGGVMLTNITYSVIEGVNFYNVNNFAIILTSTLAVKVRNITFDNCDNAIALGVGTRDCFFYGLRGNVKNNFFVFGDYLYEQFRRLHRYHIILNILVRDVKVKANTFAYFYGRNIERIVFNDIEADVTDVAFDVRKGKHICLSGLKINGKILNDDIAENSVSFIE